MSRETCLEGSHVRDLLGQIEGLPASRKRRQLPGGLNQSVRDLHPERRFFEVREDCGHRPGGDRAMRCEVCDQRTVGQKAIASGQDLKFASHEQVSKRVCKGGLGEDPEAVFDPIGVPGRHVGIDLVAHLEQGFCHQLIGIGITHEREARMVLGSLEVHQVLGFT